MQPSDEWEYDSEEDESLRDIDQDPTKNEESVSPSGYDESQTLNGKESFFTNQSYLVEYVSNLVPTFDGSKVMDLGHSFSTVSFSKVDDEIDETKTKVSTSSHSQCIIENPESIQELRDDHKQVSERSKRGEEECVRDDNSTSFSVEEHSQISEITMDIPTVVPEQTRFSQQCSALPTISEVKQFDSPHITATCAPGGRNKVQCSAGTDTTTNKSEGDNGMLDFVFELVEDALCIPMKTSKSERKKVFMEAFHEESQKVAKLANKNRSSEHSRKSSRHSRSSTRTKQAANRPRNSPTPMDERDGSTTKERESSKHSEHRSDHSRMKVVDKAPIQLQTSQPPHPLDEELTMDWSRLMSFAEKQLEAEEKSVVSKDSRTSEVSRMTGKSSVYHSVRGDFPEKSDSSVLSDEIPSNMKPIVPSMNEATPRIVIDRSHSKSPATTSVSTSSSTHATLADDVLKELRELSALDSSSFEEESSRFIMTTALFRLVRSMVPSFSDQKGGKSEEEEEEKAFDETSEISIPILDQEGEIVLMDKQSFSPKVGNEETAFKILQLIAFVFAFAFWPSGIPRKKATHIPLDVFVRGKPKSLLQLVSERQKPNKKASNFS
jgi:hypothetical protein